MRTTTRRILAVVFAGALLAAACGDDDDDAGDTTTTTEAAGDGMNGDDMATDEPGDIVEVAIAAGDFTTLVAAVEAAGLVETLQGDGPFTVFAPTDAAFDALPEGTVEGLLEDPDALADILTYHVVSGELTAADVVGESSLTTVNGASVDIMVDGDTVMIGDAQIIMTDIQASNGVIHVIDAVLIP
ncbi:MAG: fasciclin domain-containing protein [Acidimicrobiales bacterium]